MANQDPSERLFEINYFQYKSMWYNVCLWTNRYKYYYCMIKFSVPFVSLPEPDWLLDWWKKFGLNPSSIHPEVIDTARMFMFPNRRFPGTVHNLQQFSENDYKMFFIRERHPWVIRTRYVLQQDEESDEDPEMYREIYTTLGPGSLSSFP
jgi:hypothetical protein